MEFKKAMCNILKMPKKIIVSLHFLCGGCLGIPKNIAPIENFDIQKYAGLWYEIARTENFFEQNLTKVQAQYILRSDGGITVVNTGYSKKKYAWQVAKGKAYFMGNSSRAHLKLSFFGPFYSSYIIFYLDADYQYALVSGCRKSLFWILSRKPKIPFDIAQNLMAEASRQGFKTDRLIFTS